MVVDHAAKPQIKDALLEPWATDLRAAAANPLLCCKLSGLVTEADHQQWKPADLRRYIEVVLESFGVERVLFGSDWPVCTLAGTYTQVYEALMDNLSALLRRDHHDDMTAIFGGNAARFYRLDLP
jgi:L-fuconolactonase